MIPVGQETHFQRESISFLILIEFWQKGVVGKTFQNKFGIKILTELMGQRCFSGTDVSFNGDIIVFLDQGFGLFDPEISLYDLGIIRTGIQAL